MLLPQNNTKIDLLDIVLPALEAGISVDLTVVHDFKRTNKSFDQYGNISKESLNELLGTININEYSVDRFNYLKKTGKLCVGMTQNPANSNEPVYRETSHKV